MISFYHILEYVRRMEKKTGHGVTNTQITNYFKTTQVCGGVRRLKAKDLLTIGETSIGAKKHQTKLLILSPRAKRFLTEHGLEQEGFLSKKNPRITKLLDTVKKRQGMNLIGEFEYKLPFPID